MAVVVACPICSQKVRVPDNIIGKPIKCPQCKNAFKASDPNELTAAASTWMAATAPAPPPTEAAFEPPTARSRRRDDFDDEAPLPRVAAPVASKPNTLVDFLMLRRMVTPSVVVFLFYFGTIGMLIAAAVQFVTGLLMMSKRGGAQSGVITILIAVIAAPVGILLWRIVCELVIVVFEILDQLRQLNQKTRDPSPLDVKLDEPGA